MAALGAEEPVRELTILYTNDFHSAFDPIPAYWLPGTPKLGGAAQLGSLINQIRKRDKTVFLFDTGDMFTGMLSNLTRGEALMEMMTTMRYDAMAIGNHECVVYSIAATPRCGAWLEVFNGLVRCGASHLKAAP